MICFDEEPVNVLQNFKFRENPTEDGGILYSCEQNTGITKI